LQEPDKNPELPVPGLNQTSNSTRNFQISALITLAKQIYLRYGILILFLVFWNLSVI